MNKVAWYATAAFGLTALVGGPVAVAVDVALFVAGAVAMVAALVIAARRSRQSVIEIGTLFFRVPTPLLVTLGLQVAIALGTAPLRRSAAFGVLVPVFGLGLMGLWGARHGTFPARET